MMDDEEYALFCIFGTVLLIVFTCLMIGSSRSDKKIRETCEQLAADGYIEIQRGVEEGYNTAELLAIKRCDIKYGPGNYVFTSTNFNGSVWYKAHKK